VSWKGDDNIFSKEKECHSPVKTIGAEESCARVEKFASDGESNSPVANIVGGVIAFIGGSLIQPERPDVRLGFSVARAGIDIAVWMLPRIQWYFIFVKVRAFPSSDTGWRSDESLESLRGSWVTSSISAVGLQGRDNNLVYEKLGDLGLAGANKGLD